MILTNQIKELFKYQIGETVYIKQDVINDRTKWTINKEEVAQILLQHASILTAMTLEILDEESYQKHYYLRAGGLRLMTPRDRGNVNDQLRVSEHELCNEKEAIVILNLKRAND